MLTSDQAAWNQAVLDLRRAEARISTYLETFGEVVDIFRARELDAKKEMDAAIDRLRSVIDSDATAKNRGDDPSPQPLC